MSAEQTPDIAAVLAEHRLRWPTRCTCGWKTTITGDARNAEGVDVLVQYDAHIAAALAPVLAAAVREAERRALREAAADWDDPSEENRLALTQLAEAYRAGGPSMPAIFLRDRADRITEPVSHEAATSGEEASKA